MKIFKRALCIALSLVFMMQVLAGCSPAQKTDDTLYLTKGEFLSYFVYDRSMSSSKYTPEEIEDCMDGSVEADIIAEWGYLPEETAKEGLDAKVDRETVVTVCANATSHLKEGKVSDIKDADLLDNPQLIANAYASGFFELDNGYFDGAEQMSFAACEEVMNKAKKYTANFHFEANTEKTTVAEDVKEQDISNYKDGDIVIDFIANEDAPEYDTVAENASNKLVVSHLAAAKSPEVLTRDNATGEPLEATEVAENKLGRTSLIGFTAHIRKAHFVDGLKNPKLGETVTMEKYDVGNIPFTDYDKTNETEKMVGILKKADLVGDKYICLFDYPTFEVAVQKENVDEANRSGIEEKTFVKEKLEVDGWKLNFQFTNKGIDISAEKNFTVYETGRKQDWQNSKKTMKATVTYSMHDFNIDAENLKSFANKKGTGWVKVTCDTGMSFSLDTSLRYTPDSNRNGKFPSNWNNSRWTDSDSKGAKSIKIARFKPSLAGGVLGAEVYIYLKIAVDGSISFSSSIDDGGIEIKTEDGNLSLNKLGEQHTELKANVNLNGRLGVEADVTIFGFIHVIKYDFGMNLNILAVVNLYYDNQLSKSGVYADSEGLNEYLADDGKFSYCAGVVVTWSLSGELKESCVKTIVDAFNKGKILNFEYIIWEGCLHFEESGRVDKCTRGDDMDDELEKAENEEICLETYKIILDEGDSKTIKITALPKDVKNLINTKKSISVSSNDKNVCTVTYNKSNKTIIVEAKNAGSTEITVKGKSGALFWKKTHTQKISVTVKPTYNPKSNNVNYMVIIPSELSSVYSV